MKDDVDDNELLQAYKNGDVEALGKLVEHYRRPLYGFILRMQKNPTEADEIFQEVWLRAVRNLDRYEQKRFLSWLFRIAHNLIIDRARKRKPDYSLDDPGDANLPLGERIAADQRGPTTNTFAIDLGARIREAVEVLPPDQREVFLLRTENHLPFKEIATIQEVSINTALARMQYALAKLRIELADTYDEVSEENP